MNDTQDRYDELENIVMTIDSLIDEVEHDYYRNALIELRDEAKEDMEELEEELAEEAREEMEQQDYDYEYK